MFNVALGLSILVAAVVPLGQQLLLSFATPRALRISLGIFGTQLVVLLFKYILPAVAIYAVFRGLGLQRRVDFKVRGSDLILTANLAVLLFGVARALASLVEGGGAGYLLASFSPFILWPAWIAIVVGLFRLAQSQTKNAPGSSNAEGA